MISWRRPRPLDDGQVLYETPPALQIRTLMVIAVVLTVMALGFFLVVVAFWAWITRRDDGSWELFTALQMTAAQLFLMNAGIQIANARRTFLTLFAVTTRGLTLAHPKHPTRHLPWGRVAELRVVDKGFWGTEVEVITVNGERVTSPATRAGKGGRGTAALPIRLRRVAKETSAPYAAAADALLRFRQGEWDQKRYSRA